MLVTHPQPSVPGKSRRTLINGSKIVHKDNKSRVIAEALPAAKLQQVQIAIGSQEQMQQQQLLNTNPGRNNVKYNLIQFLSHFLGKM